MEFSRLFSPAEASVVGAGPQFLTPEPLHSNLQLLSALGTSRQFAATQHFGLAKRTLTEPRLRPGGLIPIRWVADSLGIPESTAA